MSDNKKISDLPDDTSVTLADYVAIVTPGSAQTKKASLARVIALADGSGGGAGTAPVFLDSFVVNLPDNETGIPNGTQVNAGDAIAPFLEAAFRKASPAQYLQPTIALTASTTPTSFEVGETLNIDFNITFHQNDAGSLATVALTKNSVPLSAISGLYSDTVVITPAPINYVPTPTYNQGPIKNDSLGNADASGRIATGSVSSVSLQYLGFYKIFFDSVAVVPSNSAQVRALSHSQLSNAGNTFILNTGNTLSSFAFALPPGKNLVSIIDMDALNLDITSQYTQSTITVNDANGNAVSYSLFAATQTIPYSTNHRHLIKIT